MCTRCRVYIPVVAANSAIRVSQPGQLGAQRRVSGFSMSALWRAVRRRLMPAGVLTDRSANLRAVRHPCVAAGVEIPESVRRFTMVKKITPDPPPVSNGSVKSTRPDDRGTGGRMCVDWVAEWRGIRMLRNGGPFTPVDAIVFGRIGGWFPLLVRSSPAPGNDEKWPSRKTNISYVF